MARWARVPAAGAILPRPAIRPAALPVGDPRRAARRQGKPGRPREAGPSREGCKERMAAPTRWASRDVSPPASRARIPRRARDAVRRSAARVHRAGSGAAARAASALQHAPPPCGAVGVDVAYLRGPVGAARGAHEGRRASASASASAALAAHLALSARHRRTEDSHGARPCILGPSFDSGVATGVGYRRDGPRA